MGFRMTGTILISICFLSLCAANGRIPFYDLERVIYPNPYTFLDGLASSQQVVVGIDNPVEVPGWGADIAMGQVVGVAVDKSGNPVVLHRANRKWTVQDYNATEHYQLTDPIKEHVLATLDAKTGKALNFWGAGLFFLPHGLTIDDLGNIWITDVGLHQVFKFAPNSQTPSLTLGERLVPGTDFNHFCKPTAVAVSSSGDFFIADGYCNNRILKFNADGSVKGQYGSAAAGDQTGSLSVPHGVDLNERTDTLCVADRENSRVVCMSAGLRQANDFGKIKSEIVQQYQSRVFDIAFCGDYLLGVAGSDREQMAIGFTADVAEGVLSIWEPMQMFHNPHAIATDEKHNSVYVSEIGPNRIWKFSLQTPASK